MFHPYGNLAQKKFASDIGHFRGVSFLLNGRLNLSFDEMWEKILARDQTYDGLFFTAVTTTKIYCRPSCKSKKPKKNHVAFFDNICDVEEAGYRPCKRCQPDLKNSPNDTLIKQAMTYMVNHFKQPPLLQDIAKFVGVNPYYLEHLFQKETGETPRSYLEKIRIDKAAFLLRNTKQTNFNICLATGFQSASNFYRVFRKMKQCSPTEYRKFQGGNLDELG